MDKVLGHILRSDEVKLEGQVRLQTKQSLRSGGIESGSLSSAMQSATAVIVENHPEFAVIEITCCCGEKMYLRCEYAGPESQKIKD
jgi:hypothetical protein